MIVTVWEDEDGNLTAKGGREPSPADINPRLLYTIEGADWNDCMRQFHEREGWEPYVPMDNGEATE